MGTTQSNKKEKFMISYTNGDRYEGEILNGIREGYGTYIYHIGDKYTGFWHENKKHGIGTLFYKEGNLYIGQWRNSEKDGIGTYYFKSGEKYVGEFKNGKKNGKGYLVCSDGNKYVGYYSENKKHGVGIMYYSNGKRNREVWEHGILIESKEIEEKQIAQINELEVNPKNLVSNIKNEGIHEILDNSFENYIDEQMKIIEQNSKNKQSKHITLEIAKYFRARIPNNYFDTMQIITSTSELIFEKPDIVDWCQTEVGQWVSLIGLEKYSQNFVEAGVDGIQFIKCNVFDLKKNFKVIDTKDLKILLKSIDFLRIFVKLRKEYQNYFNLEKIEENNELPQTQAPQALARTTVEYVDTTVKEEMKEENLSILKSKKAEYISEKKNIDGNSIDQEIQSEGHNHSIIHDNTNTFFLTKLSITKMLLHSLNLSGFNFFINYEDLKFSKKIGEGGFGEVFSGMWNGKWVAIKKFLIKENHNLKTSLTKFIKEINIISSLRHPNIVLYMGAAMNKNEYFMISEYFPKGNLFEYIHVQKGVISEQEILSIAYEIAIAIKYLHLRKVLHCDLKSSNILLDDNWKIKISDFGLSRIKNFLAISENKGRIGTPHWMAPEIMKGQRYEEASDVYSYGTWLVT